MQVHRFSTVLKTVLAAEFGPWPPEVDALLAPKSHLALRGEIAIVLGVWAPATRAATVVVPTVWDPLQGANPCALSVIWPVLVDRCGVPRPLPIYPCLSLFNSPEAVPGLSKQ